MMRAGRAGDVLPMTLTEVLVLLFFILALAVAWQVKQYQNVPLDVAREFDARANAGGEISSNWTEIFACMDAVAARGQSRSCADAMERVTSILGDVATSIGVDTTGLAPEEVLDSVAEQIRVAQAVARDAIQDLGLDSSMVKSMPLPELVNVLGGQGSQPPCWWQFVQSNREIIFVLEVILRSRDITVRRKWPDTYDEEAQRVTNLVELSEAGQIAYDDFRRLALPVYQWSLRQNPQCRHFVIIHDSVEGGDEKEDFKAAMLTVESFFYKRLVN